MINVNLAIDMNKLEEFRDEWIKKLEEIKETDIEIYNLFNRLEMKGNLRTYGPTDINLNLRYDGGTLPPLDKLFETGIIDLFNKFGVRGRITSTYSTGSTEINRRGDIEINYTDEGNYECKEVKPMDNVCMSCMKRLGDSYIVSGGHGYCCNKCAVAGEL